ncbi:transporter [Halovenus marina]|uniref:transporter n=1 Tax=Halovenus marina TaxID=3396621 RepID=UPI003F574BE3
MARRQQTQGTDEIPYVQGAIYGAVAFVIGYLITLVVVSTQEAEALTEELVEASGWLYYNAQFVDVEAAGSTFNYLSSDLVQLEAPTILYRLIPVVVLLGAGFALANQVNVREPQEGALAGATIALGTVVLAIVGTFVFEISQGGSSAGPPLVNSVLLVGLVFPAVLGGLGGVLATQT